MVNVYVCTIVYYNLNDKYLMISQANMKQIGSLRPNVPCHVQYFGLPVKDSISCFESNSMEWSLTQYTNIIKSISNLINTFIYIQREDGCQNLPVTVVTTNNIMKI